MFDAPPAASPSPAPSSAPAPAPSPVAAPAGSAPADPLEVVLAGLNDEQREAALHDGPALRVLAGAGTGKTTALTARVARLVVGGTPASRVLLLTFTRRAAREVLHRSATLLAATGTGASTGKVVGGTFHSVAHRVLRANAARIGLPEGFSVLDPGDAADVLDLVREELGFAATSGSRFPRKALLLDLYSRSVNTGRPVAEAVDALAPWCAERTEDVAAVCRGYVARKRALGTLDFDDLLLWWRAAMRDERTAARVASSFDHVLVDEYQDVNQLQVDVVQALHRGGASVTAVGDDAQAVYAFRAASADHLLRFADAFPGARTLRLCTNYRSSQAICDVANAVGDEAAEGFEVRLRAARPGDGARPTLERCADGDAEARAIADAVLRHREMGVPLRQQAVLVRASHHSDLVELEFGRRRIPFVKYGGLKFLEAAHVKDLVCAFRLADNPLDELAWFRLLQLLDGVGPSTARRALGALGLPGDGAEGDVLLRWPLAADVLPAAARPEADALAAAVARRPGEPVGAHAVRLRDALAPMHRRVHPDHAVRAGDLQVLVDAAHEAAMLSDVAADLLLEPPRSTGDLAGPPSVDEDWVVVSTVHSAKGLEWDVVHLAHAADGCFPADMSLTTPAGVEEERRLFYVGVTRPRTALHVYAPARFHHRPRGRDDAHSMAPLSRFLSPAVQACFDARARLHRDGPAGAACTEPLTRAAASVADDLAALFG